MTSERTHGARAQRIMGLTLAAACLAASAGLQSGCSKHFRVVDLNTGEAYYTKRIHKKDGGAIVFTDTQSGASVTLQSHSILKIAKGRYRSEAAVGGGSTY